jgi:hypothetical protein
MSNAKIALVDIANKIPNTYKIVVVLPIIYDKDKVQYFNNKFAMMIMESLSIGL